MASDSSRRVITYCFGDRLPFILDPCQVHNTSPIKQPNTLFMPQHSFGLIQTLPTLIWFNASVPGLTSSVQNVLPAQWVIHGFNLAL